MTSVLDQYVGCNDCIAEITVAQAFDASSSSWPDESRIAFQCATCGAMNPLIVRNDNVAEGYLSGSVEPKLVTKRVISIPGLKVRCRQSGITIKNLNLSWKIPAATPSGS